MRYINLATYLIIPLLLLTNCKSDVEKIEDLFDRGWSVLELEIKEPDHIKGLFRQGSVNYNFESIKKANHIELKISNKSGITVFSSKTSGDKVENIFKNDLRIITPINPPENYLSRFNEKQIGAMLNFLNSDINKSMPKLSMSLAFLGLTGNNYPAALNIHQFALSSRLFHGKDVNPGPPKDGNSQYLYANPFTQNKTALAIGDFGIINDLYRCGDMMGPFNDLPPEIIEAQKKACSQAGPCEDLRTDPNGDGCDGLCGPGCPDNPADDCWSWVCGDCCEHVPCKVHDNICRVGYCFEVPNPSPQCILCYTGFPLHPFLRIGC